MKGGGKRRSAVLVGNVGEELNGWMDGWVGMNAHRWNLFVCMVCVYASHRHRRCRSLSPSASIFSHFPIYLFANSIIFPPADRPTIIRIHSNQSIYAEHMQSFNAVEAFGGSSTHRLR